MKKLFAFLILCSMLLAGMIDSTKKPVRKTEPHWCSCHHAYHSVCDCKIKRD